MKSGDIVLGALPQSDGRWKLRPILLLCELPGFGDWLSLGISSQMHQAVKEWDILIDPQLPDFMTCGLRSKSIIRVGFLASLPQNAVSGIIGSVPDTVVSAIKIRLSRFIAG
jgi:mRNA interferase MazF